MALISLTCANRAKAGNLVLNQVKVILTILVGNNPRIIPLSFNEIGQLT